ncbi:hypothetical protein BH23BAC3_BH23BAC3_24940 [soil metagenome]
MIIKPKQLERIKNKISRIRKDLTADKRRWGGHHHDGRGLRYMPPGLFVKIRDYKGGLRYLRWFDKTFPDDSGYPMFLFEWVLLLFKTKNLPDAGKKVFKIYFSNSYLIDIFLGKELKEAGRPEGSNWQPVQVLDTFPYSAKDPELADFAEWLEKFVSSDRCKNFVAEITQIEVDLENEPDGEIRSELVSKKYSLIYGEI